MRLGRRRAGGSARLVVIRRDVAHAGREIGLHFGLHALWERTGRIAADYRALAAPLLREDVTACLAAAAFFKTQGKPEGWSSLYAAKAARLDAWLRRPNQGGNAISQPADFA